MVFLQRNTPINPRKRPADADAATATAGGGGGGAAVAIGKSNAKDEEQDITRMISVLADAGCTLCIPGDAPPSLPTDPHDFRRRLNSLLSPPAADHSLLRRFLSGLSFYLRSPSNLRRVLMPASRDGSLAKSLLLVPVIQPQVQQLLLEKIPEYFDTAADDLRDDVARLIVNQFRWLDFLAAPDALAEKLTEVLSIAPLPLKKEIIGSLPEIVGDQCHTTVVDALKRMLQEDSDVIMPMLDAFSNLNLDDELQEQAVTIALSCVRTVDGEHMPHLLRFLLLSATPANVGRIISQIREQLKFVAVVDPRAARNKKLKGKPSASGTDASVLEALRSSFRFKNMLCEAILKELKNLDHPRDHKVIDLWFIILIYATGGSLQKSAQKILKKKIIDGCFHEALFDQCIHGHRELVKDNFSLFLSICELLLGCKELQAREIGIHLYMSLFEEFVDAYSRQEVLGALVTHIGSGIDSEVSSAMETMILLTSKYCEELLPISSQINGILDYLEGFHDESLHKVYEIFCHLALCARSRADFSGSSIANELLIIVRKQVGNPDMKYRKMGIIGTLKIISSLGNVNAPATFSSSQKSNSEESLELLKMAIDSCKLATMPLVLLYDDLISLLECNTLQPAIMEWVAKHVGNFESLFLSDIEGGRILQKDSSNGIEGDLWMNLDGDQSPVCLNILPLISSSLQQCSYSLQILPSQFSLLSVVERLTNHGSLGGIDALLGCPLHLPSSKYLAGAEWKKLSGKQKQLVCFSIYFAINWIRELLNSFSTQVIGKVDYISQITRDGMIAKLLKRLRNLIFMETLLNALLIMYPLSLPELCYKMEHPESALLGRSTYSKQGEKRSPRSPNHKRKCKEDLMDLEKSGTNGELRQPTIVDALRKAGAVISQEVPKESRAGPSTNGNTSDCAEHQGDPNEFAHANISAAHIALDAQRSKFRPLLVDCLFMLSFSQGRNNCCSDPAAELPLHLYLLQDLHTKLDYLNPSSKKFPTICSVKALPGYRNITASEFLSKIRSLFRSLRRHLDCALSILVAEDTTNLPESCRDHWTTHSVSARNPELMCLVESKASVACAVFREVLCCYCKMLSLPDLFLQKNLPILREMLEAFQPTDNLDHFFSELQPNPTLGSIDYLYCGAYSFLEGVLDAAHSLSFRLASEVLVACQSLVSSVTLKSAKYMEGNQKNIHVGSIEKLLPFLRSKLGLSAHKLLARDWDHENNDKEGKNKGDILQKILQIYLKSSESTSDLLNQLSCSILPQVPSSRTKNTQEASHCFPTLCPTTFLTWYRALHEENLDTLNKLVKEAGVKSRLDVQREAIDQLLIKLRQTVNVVVSLVNMCKVHDKVDIHATAVKCGGKYIDTFLRVFDFLQAQFQVHKEIIIQMVKELQKATRIIQTLCSEAKGSKRTTIISKIPATKRSMERFLFRVKALLHNTSNGCTFWMGNLKHKDLFGQVVSSQAYNDGDLDPNGERQDNIEVDCDQRADNN